MDVIKAVESYPYYHSMTGQSREGWEAWRVQACEEWMLDKNILGKESERDGSSESKPDYSGNDSVLSVSTGDCGQGRGIGQCGVQNQKRLSGETRKIRESMQSLGDIPGAVH